MDKQHKHHDVIVAWAADQSKTVQYFGDGEWVDIEPGFASWSPNISYRIKPDPPAKVYPETQMSGMDLNNVYITHKGSNESGMVAVANAALRHAIDAGTVVLPNPSFMIEVKTYEEFAAKYEQQRKTRERAIARLVQSHCMEKLSYAVNMAGCSAAYERMQNLDIESLISIVTE